MQDALSTDIRTTTPDNDSLVATTLERLGADDDVRYVAGEPAGGGWVRLADAIADQAIVARWLDDIRVRNGGIDAVAASFLASWLAGVLVGPLTVAIVRERRAWSVAADDLHVHRHDDGWFDGVAIRARGIMLLPDDPDARHRDALVVDDVDGLRSAAAVQLAHTLGLLFDSINRLARLGRPAMWGAVADAAGFAAVADAASRGVDPMASFAEAMAFVDAVGDVARLPRVGPSLVQVAPGSSALEMVRGTCCLWYRTQVDPDPAGEGFCDSCPRRDPDDQRRRWASSMVETAT